MSAEIYVFIPQERIDRAVTVLDVALGRGLAFDRALYFAVESMGEEPKMVPPHIWKLIEGTWRRRTRRLAS